MRGLLGRLNAKPIPTAHRQRQCLCAKVAMSWYQQFDLAAWSSQDFRACTLGVLPEGMIAESVYRIPVLIEPILERRGDLHHD